MANSNWVFARNTVRTSVLVNQCFHYFLSSLANIIPPTATTQAPELISIKPKSALRLTSMAIPVRTIKQPTDSKAMASVLVRRIIVLLLR